MQGEFKVTPDVLKAKMEDVLQGTARTDQGLQMLEDLIARTEACWVGEAGDLYRKIFRALRPDAEAVINVWKQHAIDLGTIAGVYDAAEHENQSTADALPADAIQ